MNLEDKKVSIAFLITLFITVLLPVWFPIWNVQLFPSFLVILMYKRGLLVCLWCACACGLLLDLMSSTSHLGLIATSYAAAVAVLHRQRYIFFSDRISTLPLMTFFFSMLATIFLVGASYLFESRFPLSWNWAFTDLIVMPAVDAFCGFVLFVVPSLVFGRPQLRGKDYFASTRSPLYKRHSDS